MGRFGSRAAVRGRRRAQGDPGGEEHGPGHAGQGVPHGFDAVAEALSSGAGPDRIDAACHVLGRTLALDGASLQEAASGLRTTWRSVRDADPTHEALTTMLVSWSDTTLSYLHQLSCEDPMTGLASLAHVRSRVSEVYRAASRDGLGGSHVLVVCELTEPPRAVAGDHFTRAMHLARLGDTARTVFAGPETIGRVGSRRIVIVATRDERLATRVRLVRTLTSELEVAGSVRVWIEGLPDTEAAATTVLDELARP